jgi:hypothetical protein
VTSQLKLLSHDVNVLIGKVEHAPSLRAKLNPRDIDHLNLIETTADLLARGFDAALGLGAVLSSGLRVPSAVQARSLLEACAQLGYLRQQPDPIHSALVLRAFSLLTWCGLFPEQDPGVQEWESILSRMPPKPVSEAKQRLREKRGWTGLNTRDMLVSAGFNDYWIYQYFSAESHGGLVGADATIRLTPNATLSLGSRLSDESVETSANFGRRVIHFGFKTAWALLGGAPTSLDTEDPDVWNPPD